METVLLTILSVHYIYVEVEKKRLPTPGDLENFLDPITNCPSSLTKI